MKGCIGQRGLAVLQLRMGAALAAAGFLLGAAAVFVPDAAAVLVIVLAAAYPFAAAFWLPAWCRAACFRATADAVCVEKGILLHSAAFLSRHKIRYAAVFSTPLQRMFGIVSLRLMTAGGKVTVPMLNRSEALRLAALLRVPLADGGIRRE